jgi:hypothetical protein
MMQNSDWQADLRNLQINFSILQKRWEILKNLARERKYDPNQPRIPAGSQNAGQWTSDNDSGVALSSEVTAESPVQLVARRSQAFCDRQYANDIFQCKIVALRSCYAQAMVRLIACERGATIPPLYY